MSTSVQLQPYDRHNQKLERHVRPLNWLNPKPVSRYDLVVIGAGTAGLVAAAAASGLGAKVALIERELMGGDCLNVGCVPSKALIGASRVAATVRRAGEFGVHVPPGHHVDFPAVMERMRRLRASIAPVDSAQRFQDLGVDVFLGSGRFVDASHIDVDGTTLTFRKAVIATGARAAAPPIPGLQSIDYLTNESVFSLTELPAKLGIIGGGPIGCELAQAFARFGAEVHLIEQAPHILAREDGDAAQIVQAQMVRDGVQLWTGSKDLELSKAEGGLTAMQFKSAGQPQRVAVNQLLVAVGRAPNVEGLNLETAGIDFDTQKGVRVDDYLRTTNRRVYAAGDISSQLKFTHAADFQARIVVQNSLFKGWARASRLTIPWTTYTAPEIAHVGLYPHQAKQAGREVDTYVQDLAEVDRAVLDSREGFVKIHTRKGKDRIVGATIVAENAGDLISELTLAMQSGTGLKKLAGVIHPYPTVADAIRKVGDQYQRTRLTPRTQQLLKFLLKLP